MPAPGRAPSTVAAPSFPEAPPAAVVPITRFADYSLYRWEVAIRETVVVGVVGAGGLGQLLEHQRAAFNYQGMIALVVVSVVVDLISSAARRSLR